MWTWRTQSISLLLTVILSPKVLTDGDGTANNEDGGKSGRIIDGEEATPHEFPFQVAVVGHFKESHRQATFCGGIIIQEKYILTAAHCINKGTLGPHYSKLYFRVYAGYQDLPAILQTKASVDFGLGQQREVKRILEHRGFKPELGSLENDIALLQVDPLTLNASSGHVEKIDLPDSSYVAEGTFTAMGWGRTDNDRNPSGMGLSRHLMKVNLPFVPDDVCNQIYKNKKLVDPVSRKIFRFPPVKKSMLCAGGKGKDICQGDSGGSLIKDEEHGKRLIVGIVSWGNGKLQCGEVGVPSVFTEVSKYRQWIQDRLDGKPQPEPVLPLRNKSGSFSIIGNALKLFHCIFCSFLLLIL